MGARLHFQMQRCSAEQSPIIRNDSLYYRFSFCFDIWKLLAMTLGFHLESVHITPTGHVRMVIKA